MTNLVIDTSILVKWLNKVGEEDLGLADDLLSRCMSREFEILVPELAKYECGNALLKGKKLDLVIGFKTLRLFYSLPIVFVTETEDLAVETFRIAKEWGMTYYDASFLALAQKYQAILVTQNVKHQKRPNEIEVLSVKEFGIRFYRPFVP
ncbi:MAG: hypothetical protein UX08_C0022G0005 [Candidatus Collierbacteria bacterium GW2011_GWB1_45_35]|uniref:PIN domain-containing protein n=2 Tax=Candidatus Collieribacteriota TaxID=1752725 RepID=A0A0G1KRQ6_9BACT|nr:MAG: hypothetical protein UW48_C0016G0006 [Microgenomates group bacterium GW2011_GWC1_44_23]KKT86248.1 MAG: hypothetical protein UW84_C0014G0005 [Candidatus Collierbacteria bacterium GW2011_GWA2_44_99]KKT94626.1 MAG: hypothetical protein UW96_C0018G0013 [Candidatus Collierbacteria bacterium GW2011_GWA1_45_15]KKT99412.1 MAG: hypothetical protein UX01_C0010G0044 [Candidatus Collierbacteria bacterium GW2011_GWB2_45_17]KKU04567.1 MAG: hypothetical protein UX08_C0022G0005 [Candidatus Collierbacte